MKSILIVLSTLFITAFANAETVKLKFTYKGNALTDHTITVVTSGGSGTDVTDSGGEVSISVSSLSSKTINVYGKKTCDGGEKKFSLEGYVTLDDNNYAHVKMDAIADEMGSEMGFGGDMLAASWGLTCSGKSNSGSSETAASEDSESDDDKASSVTTNAPETKSRAEILAERKTNINNSIAMQENKIAKKQKKLEKDADKLSDQEKEMLRLEIAQHEAKNELNQVQLEEVDHEMSNGFIKKADRQDFKARKEAAKDKISANKDAQKTLKAEMKGKPSKSNPNETKPSKKEPREVISETPTEPIETETSAPDVKPIEESDKPLTSDEIHKLKMEKGKVKMKISSLETELSLKEKSLERKEAKGSLTEAEIKTKKSSIALTKEKIQNAENRLKEIESQLPEEK